jgi:hypothetical protein
VTLSDTSIVAVRVLDGGASFSSGLDRLTVETTNPRASFQIVIPRTAPLVEIRAGGRAVFRKQGARITVPTGGVTDAGYTVILKPR